MKCAASQKWRGDGQSISRGAGSIAETLKEQSGWIGVLDSRFSSRKGQHLGHVKSCDDLLKRPDGFCLVDGDYWEARQQTEALAKKRAQHQGER
jgi:hypothetical protein